MNALTRSELSGALYAQGAHYWDKHPFSRRLSAGACTPDEVRAWVGNRWYYQSNLSQKNAAIIANCPLPEVRVRWVERIKFQDEGGLADWLALGKAVGLKDFPVPLPGVRFAIDAYVRFCKDNPWYLGAAAALTELFAPDAMRDRVLAWRKHYPWIDDSGYAYFESRIPVVRDDSAYTLGLVLDHCLTRADQDLAIAALRFKCDVLWAMLDAIESARLMNPLLRRGVRFVYDEARGQHAALQPEGVQLLNDAAAAILSYCDGSRDAASIAVALASDFDGVTLTDVTDGLADLTAQGIVADASRADAALRVTPGQAASTLLSPSPDGRSRAGVIAPERIPVAGVLREPAPFGLLAELTYRCPLRCPYCSNPVEMGGEELATSDWARVFDEARGLGVLQLHLSGGEPLARKDLTQLVVHARGLGLYTNLITSGIGLSAARLDDLKDAGLDHVQLSIQDSEAASADAIAGIKAHERKQAVAKLVVAAGLPLSINVVLHRHNVTRVAGIAKLAQEMGAERLELAHTQYYGWGLLNRDALLPSREEVAIADAAAKSLAAQDMEVVYVRPDYYDGTPKPCMNGWGTRQLVITPIGDVMPCPAAMVIPDLNPASVKDTSLQDIWYDSSSFNRFRGHAWMSDPCKSCPRKEIDFGGCRCQAFQLTGNAAATDPACSLSPDHGILDRIVSGHRSMEFTPRRPG